MLNRMILGSGDKMAIITISKMENLSFNTKVNGMETGTGQALVCITTSKADNLSLNIKTGAWTGMIMAIINSKMFNLKNEMILYLQD